MKLESDWGLSDMNSKWHSLPLGNFCYSLKNSLDLQKNTDTSYTLYSFKGFDNQQVPENILGKDAKSKKFSITSDMILFNMLNVKFKRVWKVQDSCDENTVCSQEFLPLVPQNIDRDFLYYVLISSWFTSLMSVQSNGVSRSHQRITKEILFNSLIPVPPLDHQKAIAATLSCLDEKIKINATINTNLKNQSQALFKAYFEYFKHISQTELVDSELGYIPQNWRVETLSNITTTIQRLGADKSQPKLSISKDGELTLSKNYSFMKNSDIEPEKYIIVEPLDFIYNMSSATYKFVPMHKYQYNACMRDSHYTFRSEPEYHYFLEFYFKSAIFKKYADTVLERSKVAMRYSELMNMKIVYPPVEVVETFNKIYESILSTIERNTKECDRLSNLRDSLLPKLLSGEIQIPI